MRWFPLVVSITLLGVGCSGDDDGGGPSTQSTQDASASDTGQDGASDALSESAGDVSFDGAGDAGSDVSHDTMSDAVPNDVVSRDVASNDVVSSDAPDDAGQDAGCTDPCPVTDGVTWGCETRFMYGVNYAWHVFAGDFGGISAWGQEGVAAASQEVGAQLSEMRSNGVSVVRWWVFPDFRGDGVTFDGSEKPTGLGGTTVVDVQRALELADQAGVHLMLCLFSFDGFRPSQDVAGIWTPGLRSIALDGAKRQALLNDVVRPLAQTVEASPHRDRMVAWDVINEPEWAMTGASPYGDPDYDTGAGLDPITHAEMEGFVGDVIGVLRQESTAHVTVGATAWKWSQAWKAVDIDFYQFHMYPWINTYWPYDQAPSAYGVDDKPVVMGEFPFDGLGGASYEDVVSTWYGSGYAGALGWQYAEATQTQLDAVRAFSEAHPCETRYGAPGTRGALPGVKGSSASEGVPGRACRVTPEGAVCD